MKWFVTNINQRLIDPLVDFDIKINKQSFDQISFEAASIEAASLIASQSVKPLYVAFSGGYDSEYIVRLFHKLKIEFTPLIVVVEGHELERSYAYKALLELDLKAKIINLSRKDFVRTYYDYIFKKINGSLWASTHVYATKYVQSQGGSIVFGTHIGGIGSRPLKEGNREQVIVDRVNNQNQYSFVNQQIFFFKEYDYYCSALFPDTQIFDFFTHTPQIAVAMLNEIQPSDFLWEDYKERVYKLRYRPKTFDFLPNEVIDVLETIKRQRPFSPKDTVFVGNKQILKSMIVNE